MYRRMDFQEKLECPWSMKQFKASEATTIHPPDIVLRAKSRMPIRVLFRCNRNLASHSVSIRPLCRVRQIKWNFVSLETKSMTFSTTWTRLNQQMDNEEIENNDSQMPFEDNPFPLSSSRKRFLVDHGTLCFQGGRNLSWKQRSSTRKSSSRKSLSRKRIRKSKKLQSKKKSRTCNCLWICSEHKSAACA